MMGDSEVPLVGGDQAAERGPTSGPEDTPRCRNRSPPGNEIRISLGPAEPAAVTTAVGQAQQRPVTPPLTVRVRAH